MDGRTVLVTGGTTGLGFATSLGLARQGARVLLTGRDAGRAEAVARTIAATASTEVRGFGADLRSRREVDRLIDRVREAAPRLDVLVNNAGGIFARFGTTPEGHEQTWALNVLAPYLLTRGLATALRAASGPRVVMVSSPAHRWADGAFETARSDRPYSAWRTYGRSKLALILLCRAFGRRHPAAELSVNAASPGFVRTRFGRENGGLLGTGLRVAMALFAQSPARGARTAIHLASAPEVADRTGEYYADGRPARSSPMARDLALSERLWTLCAEQTGLDPGPSGPGRPAGTVGLPSAGGDPATGSAPTHGPGR